MVPAPSLRSDATSRRTSRLDGRAPEAAPSLRGWARTRGQLPTCGGGRAPGTAPGSGRVPRARRGPPRRPLPHARSVRFRESGTISPFRGGSAVRADAPPSGDGERRRHQGAVQLLEADKTAPKSERAGCAPPRTPRHRTRSAPRTIRTGARASATLPETAIICQPDGYERKREPRRAPVAADLSVLSGSDGTDTRRCASRSSPRRA